ncbi:hypothetical protein FHS51_003392 [Sphingobium wenxiniae]|jgi:hypothetical protein|uniref:Transglycosylase-like protein with SLT domain n=1 Tax=Sphingobium wenxiniae (strain DSM 21828 / CGMCC 1.7748 / JZ-1) TaxID=595605 RepID=A0A562K854_SPHWJ|nr:transglycosylase SLT domain-containing protein [Sphingobium wenxiniae]MBB6193136.1 hypothetical protein [Sphingobium wenxiniae]MBE5074975.1 transglycosylase SLT domain-containing protein [Erythrobacteraceae bacterium E2-1 Yellow Sea]TWH91582.1 transglycosylase-like protein with SLT domain [Sphingobium wenxiniae]
MALDATVLAALLQACASNVAPVTMQAIIAVESEGNPYRIGVNSGARLKRQPDNLADAIATAESLTHRGADFDAGLMQINSANFARYGLNARSVFDPCTNLRVGAAILTDNYSRARDDGHPRPWQAAVSEYNTGSRSRGLANGYVGKVYAAAGSRQALSGGAAQSGRNWTAEAVAGLIARTFDARITDTWRAMNAAYGAEHSFHKYGRAVDFVPRAGLGSIDRAQIRSLMAANGIAITELLGPGDPGHSDHWHVAFDGTGVNNPPVSPGTSFLTSADSAASTEPVRVAAVLADNTGYQHESETAPPSWDVFARARWAASPAGRQ